MIAAMERKTGLIAELCKWHKSSTSVRRRKRADVRWY
jgi:hypothetical protein